MATKTAAEKAADKAAKEAAKLAAGAPEKTQAEIDAEALDREVDAATAGPEGVVPASAPAAEPVPTAKKGVKTITPPGKFVSIDNEIYNEFGQLVGTEENASVAARKVDRFNSQRKFR